MDNLNLTPEEMEVIHALRKEKNDRIRSYTESILGGFTRMTQVKFPAWNTCEEHMRHSCSQCNFVPNESEYGHNVGIKWISELLLHLELLKGEDTCVYMEYKKKFVEFLSYYMRD